MKTIIVPVDFSKESSNAMHYGAQLAQLLKTSVTLLHVYMVPIGFSDAPLILVSSQELKHNSTISLKRYRHELENAYPGVHIHTESRLGDFASQLNEFCTETDPLLVVIGAHEDNKYEQMLFGNNAVSVVKTTRYPVLAVPENYTYKNIKTILLAADLKDITADAEQHLTSLVQLLKGQLHIVHVKKENDPTATPVITQKLQTINPVFVTIIDNDVTQGLQTYIDDIAADMLIVLPHHHNLIETFFYKKHTKNLITHTHIPVLCIRN